MRESTTLQEGDTVRGWIRYQVGAGGITFEKTITGKVIGKDARSVLVADHVLPWNMYHLPLANITEILGDAS